MKGIRAAFRAEGRDLLFQPVVWAGLVATALAAWLFARAQEVSNHYAVFSAAATAGARTASFFLIAAAATAVAGERTRGTVRWLLPRPVSRFGVVVGKSAALALAALAFALVCVAAARLAAPGREAPAAQPQPKGMHFVEEAAVPEEMSEETMLARSWQATLLLLPALLTAAGLGMFVSCLAGSAAAAVIVALALMVPLEYLPELLGWRSETARWLPFRAAEEFLAQLGEFGRGLATARWPEYGAGPLLGALLGAIGLPLLGAAVFSRLDITD